MWWCCGKTSKDAPGCRFAKHECKDDEDEDKAADPDHPNANKQRKQKCQCCKGVGHKAAECDKDPNFRGGYDVQAEHKRIMYRKEDRGEGMGHGVEVTGRLVERLSKKGAMKDLVGEDIMVFDDYNYKLLNEHIFNAVTHQSDEEREPGERTNAHYSSDNEEQTSGRED